MARIRSIHPDLLVSETMARQSAELERTFLRLLIHCDDQGRAVDNPKLLKAALYPLHDSITAATLAGELGDLEDAGLIRRYFVDGARYLCISPASWAEYQHPRHPSTARIPEPPELTPEVYGETPRDARQAHASVGVGVGVGEGVLAPPQAAGAREADPIWDALIGACGITGPVPRSAHGAYSKAVAELRAVDATPSEIRKRAAVFRGRWPQASLTPTALARRWGECERNGQTGAVLSPAAARLATMGDS